MNTTTETVYYDRHGGPYRQRDHVQVVELLTEPGVWSVVTNVPGGVCFERGTFTEAHAHALDHAYAGGDLVRVDIIRVVR